MPNMLENYGLDFISESEEALNGFLGYVAEEGKAITGYYGTPYLYKSMGDVEFWESVDKAPDGKLFISGFNSHCAGRCVFELVHSGIDITPKGSSKLERVIIFNKSDENSGSLPVHLITADVLPSFLSGDKITMQVVALPLEIEYYNDEEEYAEAQPTGEDGKKFLLDYGSLAPLFFICNHMSKNREEGKTYDNDSFVQFVAKVKGLYKGTIKIGDDEDFAFIRCIADTKFGELEFNHSIDQMPKEQRDKIKVGAIISGTCIISGDVAIYEYENGIVKDFDHDIRLLRYTFSGGDPERLGSVLAENAVYETDTTGKSYIGPREIIDRFAFVSNNRKNKYIAHLATITSVGGDDAEYPVGTRCIVLESEGEEGYESIAFITVDGDGMITKIKISTDCRYKFQIDRSEKLKTPLDDVKIPENVFHTMLLRSKFLDIIPRDTDESSFVESTEDCLLFEENAQEIFDALKNYPEENVDQYFKNTFGYMFAKGIEKEALKGRSGDDYKLSFNVDDAIHGRISSALTPSEHAALEKAMEQGKQFFNDFEAFVIMIKATTDKFEEVFGQAMAGVQRLGEMYSASCLKNK